jgi:hypothetical protein
VFACTSADSVSPSASPPGNPAAIERLRAKELITSTRASDSLDPGLSGLPDLRFPPKRQFFDRFVGLGCHLSTKQPNFIPNQSLEMLSFR